MREALISIKIKPRLESGQNKGGWAGFVFNNIDYCFFIPYAQFLDMYALFSIALEFK